MAAPRSGRENKKSIGQVQCHPAMSSSELPSPELGPSTHEVTLVSGVVPSRAGAARAAYV